MKIRLNEQLEFFNIGFRCANISGELINLKYNRDYNSDLLNDAYNIINNCRTSFQDNLKRDFSNYRNLILKSAGFYSDKPLKEKEKLLIKTKKELNQL